MNFQHIMAHLVNALEIFLHLHLLLGFITFVIVMGLLRKHLKHSRYRSVNWHQFKFDKIKSPKVTIIIPAYNEGMAVGETIEAALSSDYPNFDVYIVNDGSTDEMMNFLRDHYQLEESIYVKVGKLSKTHINGFYLSKNQSRLKVIDKVHSGKADSLNLSIDLIHTDYVICLDADSIILPSALATIMCKFLDEPHLVALGGAILPSNNIYFKAGKAFKKEKTDSVLVHLQVIEYLRSFTAWRTGWSYLDGLLVIGGALTGLQTKAVREVGGYRKGFMCEDLELILTLHEHFLKEKKTYHIWNLQDVICWTRVPVSMNHLKRQRMRWMYGALQSINNHRNLMFTTKNFLLGWMAFPHLVFIEVCAPPLEFLGLLSFFLAASFNLLSFESVFIYGLLIYALTGFYSWNAILINDLFMRSSSSVGEILKIGMIGLLEPIGFRQRDAIWRMHAWWKYLRKKDINW